MVCPDCGLKNPDFEYITGDVIKCDCGYVDEICMFEERTLKKMNKVHRKKFDDDEMDE